MDISEYETIKEVIKLLEIAEYWAKEAEVKIPLEEALRNLKAIME